MEDENATTRYVQAQSYAVLVSGIKAPKENLGKAISLESVELIFRQIFGEDFDGLVPVYDHIETERLLRQRQWRDRCRRATAAPGFSQGN